MHLRLCLALATTLLLSACATHNGVYAPDCIAYAGDRIEIDDGRFVWDKFTDQVVINKDGESVDQYRDYPVQGRYLMDGNLIRFLPETDVSLPDLYLIERGRQHYLLTTAQYGTWRVSGNFANCALILGGGQ